VSSGSTARVLDRALRRCRLARRRELSSPRLCMLVHGPFPLDPRVSRAAKVALSEGYEVDVLATRQPGEPPEQDVGGVKVFRLPIAHEMGRGPLRLASEYLGFTLLASPRLAWRAWKHRYAIVHVHNPPDFLIAAALVPKLLGSRVILDVHDLSPDMFKMRFDGPKAAPVADRLLRALERWATRRADGVITVHDAYARELQRRGVPAEKLTVVMNSVDEQSLPAPAKPSDQEFRVVYHGTVTPPYGVELVVEAVAGLVGRVPHIRLDVYGAGDSVESARKRAAALGVEGRVHFSGRYLSQPEVLERVRSANVGVIPNRPTQLNRFALSTKLFEYVALGVPVVSADLPTIREHFADDELCFFHAGESDSLAEALFDVATNPATARTRADNALRRYQAYRWPENAAKYAGLLDRMTSEASGRGA
jgi:glycosyltransferase involved in cell wall biosynthesis